MMKYESLTFLPPSVFSKKQLKKGFFEPKIES